jgi:dTDP-4-dehydrorhamnose 3,5-epimerase-like enzyme
MGHVKQCRIIDLPKITDPRGNLSFIEGGRHIPFEIKRVFYLYDVPTGEDRGAHAHKKLHQFLICLSGSFDVLLDDGYEKQSVHLNRPWKGLHIPPMIWASEVNFDPGSVCLVLASDLYDESDYIRDYQEFLRLANKKCAYPFSI